MKINTAIQQLLQTRHNMVNLLENNSDLLYTQKENFNNTLFWNAAHSVVTLQLLVYGLSKQKMHLKTTVIDRYRKGTKNEGEDALSPEELKSLLISTAEQLEQDVKNGLLDADYASYETSYGIVLNSVEEAITFNNLHEALHLGYMMAQARA